MRKFISLVLCIITLMSVLTGCAVLDNEVVLNKNDVPQETNTATVNPEKQSHYEGYFVSDKVGFETLTYTKLGDYSVETIKTENGNIKVNIQIDKTHKMTSYYIDKTEYVEYDNAGKVEWYKTTGKTSFISLLGTEGMTSSVNVESIKKITYISTENGIDKLSVESTDGNITILIRESSQKIVGMMSEGVEMRFSDIPEKNDKISFKAPSKFTEKSANEIQNIMFSVLGA